jgi:hypothetical protein
MIQAVCDIWDMYDQGETVCITTNGFVTRGGNAVMGRGVAAQAVKRFPTLKAKMGRYIMENGNIVQRIAKRIVSFPVKPQLGICNEYKTNVVKHMRHQYKPYDWVPGWAMMADLNIIEHSLWDLQQLHDHGFFKRIYLPKPGCGAGGLDWEEVRPYCEMYSSGGAEWLVVCDLT